MRNERSAQQKTDNSAAVSEIIGAVLLISLVVVAIGIVAAMLFGQQTPTKIPNMNFMTGVSADQHTLYLTHTGGDTLKLNEFSVVLDGVQASSPTVSGGGSQWSLGTTLIVPISKVPQNVQIVYNSSGSAGAVLLRQGSYVNTTVNVSADQAPYLDCSAVKNWACADQIPSEIIIARYSSNTTSQRIGLMQFGQSRGTVVGGATNHFNFTVANDNSTIMPGTDQCTSGTLYHLKTGDKLGITFISNPDHFTVYGSAPQIWEMVGGDSSRLRITISYVNGTNEVIIGQTLCHTYIDKYSDLDSTLVVTTTSPGDITALTVNTTRVIEGTTSTTITLINVVPIGNGLFLITYGANTAPIYVIGWADQILFNGVPQTGLGV